MNPGGVFCQQTKNLSMLRMLTGFLFPAYESKLSTLKKKTGLSLKAGFS